MTMDNSAGQDDEISGRFPDIIELAKRLVEIKRKIKIEKNVIELYGDNDENERVVQAKKEIKKLVQEREEIQGMLFIPVVRIINRITMEQFEQYKQSLLRPHKQKLFFLLFPHPV